MKKYTIILSIILLFLFFISIPNICNAYNNTITINDAMELSKIGNDPNYPASGSYTLANDIILDNSFVPLFQDEVNPFTGSFNGQSRTITLNWNDENLYLFKYISNAKIKNLNIYVNGQNLRTTLCYNAAYSDFSNIYIDGSITKPSYQIGGLVWVCYGCTFNTVSSKVDLSLTNINFDKYNIVGGIVCQVTAEQGTFPWSGGVYANNFIKCSYSGTIYANLDTASYENVGSTAFWVGSLYGATAYDSPTSYFGINIENCYIGAKYNITGSLDTSKVTQYNFINKDGKAFATYVEGNKSVSAKIEEEIIKIGRTHQNIHLNYANFGLVKTSYGYFGESCLEQNAGEHLWSSVVPNPYLTASLIVLFSIFAFIIIFLSIIIL